MEQQISGELPSYIFQHLYLGATQVVDLVEVDHSPPMYWKLHVLLTIY